MFRGNVDESWHSGQATQTLRIANAVWGEQSFPFSQSYNVQIGQYYGAELYLTDFKNVPEEARDEINKWVGKKTENRILNVVPDGVITSLTRLVLANAIYFHGSYLHPFALRHTQRDKFHLLNGSTITVSFMFQQENFRYLRGEGIQAIEFPYYPGFFTFTIVLPDKGKFSEIEASLNANSLNAITGQLQYTYQKVYFPKFEFEFGVRLAEKLSLMGMPSAFDPIHADLRGMVDGEASERLFLGNLLHKAFISVDENGTEAAAATISELYTGVGMRKSKPIEVRIDRPFIFVIRDTQTGTLLFVGRVLNPSS
jgi:serpin B